MHLNEINYNDGIPVDGYGPGFFRIGGEVFEGAVITGPTGTSLWAGFADTKALTDLAEHVDVVFLGTGNDVSHPPADFRAVLEAAGLGIEPMNSPAAARSYNVLLSEGRRVALAMLPVV